MMTEAWSERCYVADFEDGEGEPRMSQGCRQPLEAGKVKETNRFSPRASRKECNAANILILPTETSVGLLTYRTIR